MTSGKWLSLSEFLSLCLCKGIMPWSGCGLAEVDAPGSARKEVAILFIPTVRSMQRT